MTAAASSDHQTRLPQLSGRWVSAYVTVWSVLALGVVVVIAASLYWGNAHPAVLTLRVLKAIVVISFCAILLRRRRNDPVAALLSIAFLTWTITSSFDFASSAVVPMLFDRARFLLFVVALLLFPNGTRHGGWTRTLALASAGVFLLGIAEGSGISTTHLFLPLGIACVLAAVLSLVSRFRTADSEATRQQLKWVALGLVAGIGLILIARGGAKLTQASPRLTDTPILWEALFQFGIIVIASGFLVSLLRYRLFDAEAAISRSAALAVLTITLVAAFAGTEATIEWIGQQYLGMGVGNVSAAMAAAVAAVLLNPLHSRIADWAEDQFQPDLVLLKRQLPDLLARPSLNSSSGLLGAAVLSMINVAIHATRSAIFSEGRILAACGLTLPEARRWARDSISGKAAICDRDCNDQTFPLRLPVGSTQSGKTAWLLLGPRPDGTLYGREDLEAVRSILPAVRNGLASAQAREAIDAALRSRERRLKTDIADLCARLCALEAATA